MANPSNILILGASRGIGLGLVKNTLAKYPSTKLYATVRSTKTATALQKLADDSKGRLVLLDADFTDSASVKALRSNVETFTSSLDQVIYNAGVLKGLAPITKAGLDPLRENLEVNLFGAYAAAIEFTPFVQRSNYPNKVFIIVGSNFGSLTTAKQNFDAHNAAFGTVGVNYTAAYDISKTAVSRLAVELDLELRPKGVPVLLVHPGLPKTDMNPAGNITVEDSVNGLVEVFANYSADRKEQFLDYRGEIVPW